MFAVNTNCKDNQETLKTSMNNQGHAICYVDFWGISKYFLFCFYKVNIPKQELVVVENSSSGSLRQCCTPTPNNLWESSSHCFCGNKTPSPKLQDGKVPVYQYYWLAN